MFFRRYRKVIPAINEVPTVRFSSNFFQVGHIATIWCGIDALDDRGFQFCKALRVADLCETCELLILRSGNLLVGIQQT